MKTPDSIEKLNEYELQVLLKQVLEDAIAKDVCDPVVSVKYVLDNIFYLKLSNGQKFYLKIEEVT